MAGLMGNFIGPYFTWLGLERKNPIPSLVGEDSKPTIFTVWLITRGNHFHEKVEFADSF